MTQSQTEFIKTIDEVAQEVIAGKWGTGNDLKAALTKAGYNYLAVQTKVNHLTGVGKTKVNKKSVGELAREVIKGRWGNGIERKRKLEAAGYNYVEVQREVDRLLRK